MNKLFLLPISLLLLNPAFAADIESSPLSSEVAIVAAEETLIEPLPQAEIAQAERPASPAITIQIDPQVLQDLQAEIAAMIEDTDVVDNEAGIENEIAYREEPVRAKQPVYYEEDESAYDEDEIAQDEEEFAEEEIVEAPPVIQRKAPSKTGRPSKQLKERNEKIAEKEPGSHVRRYTTKPSQAPKVQQEVADSDYQKPAPKKVNPPVKRNAVKPLKAPQVQEEVADSELEQPVVKKQAPKAKAQTQQRRTADAQTEQRQQKAPAKKQPSQMTQKNQPQAKQSAPAKKPSARVQSPEATQSVPPQAQAKPKQSAPAKKPDVRVQAPQANKKSQAQAQAPAKAQSSRRAMAQQPASVPAAKPQAGRIQQNRVAQDDQGQMNSQGQMNDQSQGQMNSQGMQNSQGQMNGQSQGMQNSQGQMNAKPKAAMKQNGQNTMNGKMYNTAARPVVKGGANLWVMGDALLWQAVEENLTYVYNQQGPALQNNLNMHTVDFSWDWGFRIGAGYNTPRDGWDIDLYWTHIRNTASDKQSLKSSDSALTQVFFDANSSPLASILEGKAHLHINLNQVDLELGRQFYVGKHLMVRPYMGMRSTWISQKYNVDMIGNANPLFATGIIEQSVKMKNRFWGYGFAAGLCTDWMLGWGISIYGDADMAILLGFFDIDQTGKAAGTNLWSTDKSFRTGRPILDIDLGLKWSHLFADSRFGLTFKAGYEYHLYFNQNQFLVTNGDDDFQLFNPAKGDLTYQGVIGSIQFDF